MVVPQTQNKPTTIRELCTAPLFSGDSREGCRSRPDTGLSVRPIFQTTLFAQSYLGGPFFARPQGATILHAAPPPDEKAVKEALLSLLRDRGVEPLDGWLAVRVVKWPRERMYTVIIAYEPARVALAGLLYGDVASARKDGVGIWVLDESEARNLCDRANP